MEEVIMQMIHQNVQDIDQNVTKVYEVLAPLFFKEFF